MFAAVVTFLHRPGPYLSNAEVWIPLLLVVLVVNEILFRRVAKRLVIGGETEVKAIVDAKVRG